MLLPQIPKSLFITVMIDDFRFSKCSLNAIFSEHLQQLSEAVHHGLFVLHERVGVAV